MNKYSVVIWLLFVSSILCASEVVNLRCEYLINPVGVDVTSPRLSWEIISSKRGDLQRASQIIVSSSPENLAKEEGDLWNTGKIGSAQSIQVEYQGKLLQSGVKYFWKVMVGEDHGKTIYKVGSRNYSFQSIIK